MPQEVRYTTEVVTPHAAQVLLILGSGLISLIELMNQRRESFADVLHCSFHTCITNSLALLLSQFVIITDKVIILFDLI